jgi:hypothetical protein
MAVKMVWSAWARTYVRRDGSWIFVNITTAFLGIEMYEWMRDWLSTQLLWRLGILKSIGLALGSVYFMHGVFGATTTCTCLSITNNGIHDSVLSVLVNCRNTNARGVPSPRR